MSQEPSNDRGRGRPPTFTSEDREYFAELIRECGVRGAQRQSKLSVSKATLIGVAREHGIVMKKGKRPRQQATISLSETRFEHTGSVESQDRKAA